MILLSTQGMKVDNDLLEKIRAVRRKLAADGPVRVRSAGDFERVSIGRSDSDVLRDLVLAERARTVIEIGLGYGSSALAIAEALVANGPGQGCHLIIDAYQDRFHGSGWSAIVEAGITDLCLLFEERSQIVLPCLLSSTRTTDSRVAAECAEFLFCSAPRPAACAPILNAHNGHQTACAPILNAHNGHQTACALLSDGYLADAAFVDGSHIFHNLFVDLFYLRELVRPGGLVILDDCSYPSVATAVRYFQLNTGWEPEPMPAPTRLRAFRLPNPRTEPEFESFKPF